MKVKLTKEMREKIYIGLIISTFTLLLYYVLTNGSVVLGFLDSLKAILAPFIFGFALAFLLNPIMCFFEDKVFGKWNCKRKLKRVISMLIALLIAIVVVVFLILMIIPAIVDSISDLLANSEAYIVSFTKMVTPVFEQLHLDTSLVDKIVGEGNAFVKEFGTFFSEAIPALISTSYGVIKTLLNVLIGMAAAMYMLLDKEYFITMITKFNFAVFPEHTASYLSSLATVIKNVFYDFIIGKAIDSFIIGIICYVGLMILDIEYAALFSIIVGVTNMIPVFGPFIGAIPGGVILLIINPVHSITFLLFILALQQFDGNILGPLILGDKLGLPSFFILLSVSLGGSLFGVIGMFIAVPTFAIFYYSITAYTEIRLNKKNINIEEEKANINTIETTKN